MCVFTITGARSKVNSFKRFSVKSSSVNVASTLPFKWRHKAVSRPRTALPRSGQTAGQRRAWICIKLRGMQTLEFCMTRLLELCDGCHQGPPSDVQFNRNEKFAFSALCTPCYDSTRCAKVLVLRCLIDLVQYFNERMLSKR